jgi:uncharacterized protein (DUF2336 family)
MSTTRQSVIEELEEALSSRAIGYRADTLRRVTDLFLSGPADYSEGEVAVFDDVMVRLVEEMQTSVRAALAERLAAIPNAPQTLVRRLAADAAIEVAGPVLRVSKRLDDAALVENARTSSQDHLMAISQRSSISEAVTDVLIERGDRTVALSTVRNAGARFSSAGQEALVERSKEDGDLALGVWSRADVPHHRLLRLFSAASESVRKTLETADRQKVEFIRDIVADVSNEMQTRLRAQSRDYIAARQSVAELRRRGELDESVLENFALGGRFDETAVALSILCDLPIGAVERAMVNERPELVLLLARAIGLSWPTAKAILLLRAGDAGMSPPQREQSLAAFSKLRPETAAKALQFLRLRERALAARSGSDR